jgi:hypothetical protein
MPQLTEGRSKDDSAVVAPVVVSDVKILNSNLPDKTQSLYENHVAQESMGPSSILRFEHDSAVGGQDAAKGDYSKMFKDGSDELLRGDISPTNP